MAATPPQPFRFLDLPSELRNNIYSLLLENDTSIRFVLAGGVAEDTKVQPPFLLTCRQINIEATSILYANNIFTFEWDFPLQVFATRIGKENLPQVRHIELEQIGYKPNFGKLLSKLEGATRLEVFKIKGVSSRYKKPNNFVNANSAADARVAQSEDG